MSKMLELHEEYEYIVVFPTDEEHIRLLLEIRDSIGQFCFLPFDERSIANKYDQYLWSRTLRVPCPETILLSKPSDYEKVLEMLPAIIKPIVKYDGVGIKNIRLYSPSDYRMNRDRVEKRLSEGFEFVASDIIPGDGDQIFAYICYRTKNGKILNEWTGCKLSQHPDNFGVFASARSCTCSMVAEQGRWLVEGANLFGILEPEFKYDYRDGKYKLIEINFRSMMWHRI
ncbi:unnamed protein product, partial [marine sediment metagenome]